MSGLDFFFALRQDYKGRLTPSEAARWWLIFVMAAVGFWAWPIADGHLVMWFAITIFSSTPLLFVGWYFFSLLANGREPRVLTPSVKNTPRFQQRMEGQKKG